MSNQDDEQNRALDEQLGMLLDNRALPPAPAHLTQRILANLPPRTPLESIAGWLQTSPWRTAMAATLPILLGFSLGFSGYVADPDAVNLDVEAIVFADNLGDYLNTEVGDEF